MRSWSWTAAVETALRDRAGGRRARHRGARLAGFRSPEQPRDRLMLGRLGVPRSTRTSACRETCATKFRALLSNPAFDVYEMPRSSYYCGHFMRHSGWWPDYVRRLFRRGTARFSSAPVHESLQTDRKIGRHFSPLEHWNFRTMEQVLHKVNHYSSLSAPMVLQRGRRPTVMTAVLSRRFRVLPHLLSEARLS